MNPESPEIPPDWDSLGDRESEPRLEEPFPEPDDGEPQVLTLMAVSWADLVGMLAVCTGALLAILALGQRPGLAAFGWAAVLALVWWACAAAALIVVRQGTPGMLLAGVRFFTPVEPDRVPRVLAAAVFGVLTFGLPGLLGHSLSPLKLAAASDIVADTTV